MVEKEEKVLTKVLDYLDLPPSDVHFFGLKKGYVQTIASGLPGVPACGQRDVVSLSDTPFALYCQQKVYVKWGLLHFWLLKELLMN